MARSRKRCDVDRSDREFQGGRFAPPAESVQKVAEICFTGAARLKGKKRGRTCHAVIFLLIRHRFVPTLKVYRICFPVSAVFHSLFLSPCFVSFLLFSFLFFLFRLTEREREKGKGKRGKVSRLLRRPAINLEGQAQQTASSLVRFHPVISCFTEHLL